MTTRILTSQRMLAALDLSAQKMTKFAEPSHPVPYPLDVEWETPSPIVIQKGDPSSQRGTVHAFCGGLPALMQACRAVEAGKQVLMLGDGEIAKSTLSGHQMHVHPSEWTSPECRLPHLVKLALQGMKLLSPQDPKNLRNYSYLHIPYRGIRTFGLCAKFGTQLVMRWIEGKPSVDDEMLCQRIRNSLGYHSALSKKIAVQQGMPLLITEGRFYISPSEEGIKRREKTWGQMGIPVRRLSIQEAAPRSLLRPDAPLYVLEATQDGKFFPGTVERVQDYLTAAYPALFEARRCRVQTVEVDGDYHPLSMTSEGQSFPIQSFFGSPGHAQVFMREKGGHLRQLWTEVPVAGVSTLWECTLSTDYLEGHFGKRFSPMALQAKTECFVPFANLSNLHCTVLKSYVNEGKVTLYVRVTQGANFDSTVAEKGDLYNMVSSINAFCIGQWKLLSAGSCVRKTGPRNIPQLFALSDRLAFAYNASGVGVSISADDASRWI